MSQEEDFILPDGRKTSELKVVDLKKELEKVGKRRTGSKSELLNRLKEALSASTNSCEDNHKESPVVSKELKIQRTICNSKKVSCVDLDDSDDMKHDGMEINQSMDTLELGVPMDDSLNPMDDTAQEDQIQISLSKDEEAEMSLEDKDDRVPPEEDESKDQRVVLCEEADVEEEPKRNVIENEGDLMLEVFAADNIDLEVDDREKKAVGSDSETITVTLVNETSKKKDEISAMEEGETVSTSGTGLAAVSITSRLGKRKIKEEEGGADAAMAVVISTKKPASGVRETKASGHSVEEPMRVRSPHKSRSIISDILRVEHLVRPFTMTQLQDVLSARGKVIDLWLNKIKSIAYVRYESESAAINARESLDGCKWPSINPKLLEADFATTKEMEWMKERGDSGMALPAHLRQAGAEGDHGARPRDRRPPPDPATSHSNGPGNRRKSGSPERRRDRKEAPKEIPKEVPPAAKAARVLEDIFRKTTTQPPIYWLPVVKEKAIPGNVAGAVAAAATKDDSKITDRWVVGGL